MLRGMSPRQRALQLFASLRVWDTEENSGVLIERYEKLNFSIKHEHPDSGHNVWQETYEDLKGKIVARTDPLSGSAWKSKSTGAVALQE